MEWRIFPLDPLFFRGTESMNAGETDVVSGIFPPTPLVLQGFVRTTLIETMDVPFLEYAHAATGGANASNSAKEAVEVLGPPGDQLGRLDLHGPYLIRERGGRCQRLYPAPSDLIEKGGSWRPQKPSVVVESDLGRVRYIPRPGAATGYFVTEDGLERYLAEALLGPADLVPAEALFLQEQRIGIARDSMTQVARDQHLYSVVFTRLEDRDEVSRGRVGLAVRVDGVDREIQRRCAGVRRLGGEGRLVELQIADEEGSIPQAPPVEGNTYRLVLLTPARWDGMWLPSRSEYAASVGGWSVSVNGCDVTVISAVVGKTRRVGGWDIVRRTSKPAEACVPAGSVYFVRIADSSRVTPLLHDRKVGAGASIGFGHLVLGRWTDTEGGR